MKWKIILFSVFGLIAITLLLAYLQIIPGIFRKDIEQISLTVVGPEDNRAMYDVIDLYQAEHPNVKITYLQKNPDNYEQELLNLLASGEKVDAMYFKSSWLSKHFNKIIPAREEEMTLTRFENIFPTVVRQDFAPDNYVFGLPLYLDTLGVIYNKNLFDAASVATRPKTWVDFQDAILKVRKLGKKNMIEVAGAAIGGNDTNTLRGPEVLQTLMMQSGAVMVDRVGGGVTFDREGLPGLNFYLSFTDPKNTYYTWNSKELDAPTLFSQGKLGMLFGYFEDYRTLARAFPNIEIGSFAMPQPFNTEKPLTLADYYGLAVSAASKNQAEAWKFIVFATTNSSAIQSYLNATGHIPALREYLSLAVNNPEMSEFASQALIARSWIRPDDSVVRSAFNRLIQEAGSGRIREDQALEQAASTISSSFRYQ